jgi:hypothetical protein
MNRQNCFVFCIRTLILYITCRQAWSVRSYRSSNEYQQYVKYVEFHRDYGVANTIKSDAIGNKTLTTVITHDIAMSRIHQCNYERLNYCGEETVTFFNHHIPLFWHTTPNTSTAPTLFKSKFFTNIEQSAWYKANIDCHYEVVDRQFYRIIQQFDVLLLDIHFQLIQSQCINYTRPLLGGSSFEIVMENELSFVSCGVIDKFDNTYDVNCTIPFAATTGNSSHDDTHSQTNRRSGRGSHDQVNSLSDSIDVSTGSDHNKSLMCFNVTVTLDYEHYSAFTDSKLTPVKLRHHILNARSICRQLSSSRDHMGHIHPQDDDLRGYYIKHPPLEHRSHDLGDDRHHQDHHQSYHSYYYLSNDRIFLDRHAIARCFNDSHPLFMLGNYNCPRCM